MFNGAKRMTCTEVRDILSDLIDVRNGEIPPVGVSRLSQPEVRADAESHLASCSDCRGELVILEEVGSVFSDFNVGELPVQHFANYGQVVRDHMAKSNFSPVAQSNNQKIVPIRAPGRAAGFARWWKVGASAAAAAAIAFSVMHFMPHKVKKDTQVAIADRVAPAKISRPDTPIPTFTNNKSISGMLAVNQAATGTHVRELVPQGKMSLDDLRRYEKKMGSVILSDSSPDSASPLLGAVVKTIREEDRDLTKVGSLGLHVFDVVPESVANEIDVRKDDTIVCINGMDVNAGGVEDAFKFITAIQNMGKGAVITIDIVRQDKYGVIYKRCRGVLGEPKAVFE